MRNPFRRHDRDAEIREELEHHLAERSEQLGHDEARKRFGNVLQTQEGVRAVEVAPWRESVAQDLRYALRSFGRAPGFTATVLLTIALGVGCATAVFSFVDRILFRNLPYPEAERLVSFGLAAPIEPIEFMLGSDYVEWRRAEGPFESMGTWTPGGGECDVTDRNPQRLTCVAVERTLLSTLGVLPVVGRNFTAEEDRPGGPPAAIISHGLWASRFGSDAGITGKTISLDGRSVTVIGVLPADFEFPSLGRADILVPQMLNEAEQVRPRTGRVLRAVARLRPGVSVAAAETALEQQYREALKWTPPQFRNEVKLRVRSLRDRQIADVRQAAWLLFLAVLAVLLIASANGASLLLARASARTRDLAVRAALGAGRGRLARQALTESLLLGAGGGLLGCALAWGLLRLLLRLAPGGIPRLAQAAIDTRVLLFAVAVTVLTSLLFGIVPALMIPRAEELSGTRVAGSGRPWFRKLFLGGQFAGSVALLGAATLLVRSLWELERTPVGLQADHLIVAHIALSASGYPSTERQWAFYAELEELASRMPGLDAFALSDTLPPGGMMRAMLFAAIDVEGKTQSQGGTGGMVAWRSVTPGYFRTLGIPIRAGRGFSEDDRTSAEDVVILNELLAARLFPDGMSMGKRIRPGRTGPWHTVAGVVANTKNGGIGQGADPEYYVLRKKVGPAPPMRRTSLAVRTPMAAGTVAEWLRREISAIDATLPVEIETMRERLSRQTTRPRFNAWLLAAFAAMGLALAGVGLYGVTAQLVAQRTREIGVRMALGASAGQIVRLVVGGTGRWVLGGAVLGLAGCVAAARSLQPMLYMAPKLDWQTPVIAMVVLGCAALLAAWIPSRRAVRVDPSAALRQE